MFSYDVKMTKLKTPITVGKSSIKAFLDFIIDDAILFKGFKLMETDGRLWVSAPSKKGKDDKYHDEIMFIGDRDETTKMTAIQSAMFTLAKERYMEGSTPSSSKSNVARAREAARAPVKTEDLDIDSDIDDAW